MNHKQVAERILNAVGRDNIQGAAHCATRLRLVLKDTGVIDQEALDNDPDLKGTFEAAGQYQINGEKKMAKWIKVLTGCVVAVLVFFLNGIEAGEHIPENRK